MMRWTHVCHLALLWEGSAVRWSLCSCVRGVLVVRLHAGVVVQPQVPGGAGALPGVVVLAVAGAAVGVR